jgi:hypothetical protein
MGACDMIMDIKANEGNPTSGFNKMIRLLCLLFSVYIMYMAVAIPVRIFMKNL